ncbi:MAG TPA: 3-hydroxyacyl-CoA dehydrogenase NAD-binding domain-containing protein [Steroidobacteraceae bacterium]|nr:3-hydroxyacyl-CoA dehydrogenase NAD-binding domain-containing protein [Steroidobacteraceae bacterium]
MSADGPVRRDGDVAVFTFDNPPVNALSQPVREALLAAIESLEADPSVRAVVLAGKGRNFVAGADVREFDRPPLEPLLPAVLARVEACGKPVVAALAGATLGGGAETALACHYRCAAGDLQLGFPEVNLGLLPGAGGTVRLPRLAGWQASLDLMTGGKPLGIDPAIELGIVDRRVDGDLVAGAVAWARELAEAGLPPRRVLELQVPPSRPAQFEDYLRALPASARKLPAPPRIVEALACAAILPAEAALARARTLFMECLASVESRALRHLFFAERRPTADPALARPVAQSAVIGAGTMGAGITVSLATGGIGVTLIDARQEALDAGIARVNSLIDASERKGRLDPAAAAAARGRVRGSLTLAAVAGAELVIEAVFENLAVKRELFSRLGELAGPGCVLATNTSTLDVDAIAASSGRPADVVGMHFFSPAHVMRLVEVVRGRDSSRESLATAHAVTKRIGKIAIPVGNAFGFVGNRMLYAYGREKELVMLEGARPEAVDRALQDFGMAMGPNAVGDLAGLDIGWQVRKEWQDKPDDPRFYRVSDRLAELGRFGQKTGRGFYRYDGPGGERTPDPELVDLILAEAERLGIPQRTVDAGEIVNRCVLALVNEGARILEEGIAETPADIDVIWCNGYGFPRHRGGPMFHADSLGLAAVLRSIRALSAAHGARYWEPAGLLAKLAGEGTTFAAWQAARSGG